MIRWEFKELIGPNNELKAQTGQLGWELVSVVCGTGTGRFYYFYKRPIEDESEIENGK